MMFLVFLLELNGENINPTFDEYMGEKYLSYAEFLFKINSRLKERRN